MLTFRSDRRLAVRLRNHRTLFFGVERLAHPGPQPVRRPTVKRAVVCSEGLPAYVRSVRPDNAVCFLILVLLWYGPGSVCFVQTGPGQAPIIRPRTEADAVAIWRAYAPDSHPT